MSDTKIIIQAPSQEEVLQYKRRLFETADRSYLNDRLNVPLPPELYGEWIGTDDFSQYNAIQRGFIDGAEYLTEFNKVHDTSSGSVIGDVKFMVIPKWKYEAQREIAALESARRSGLNANQTDEEYKSYAKSIGLGIDDSLKTTARRVSGEELQATLNR